MILLGYGIVLAALYILYSNELFFGGFLFTLGGFLAQKISISVRSAGVLILVIGLFYGYHNSFTPELLVILLIGFVMACFNTRRTSAHSDWGIDIGWGSSDGDCGGSDGGGGD